MRKAPVALVVLAMAVRPGLACTVEDAREKRAVAWDRAALLSARDLDHGRALEQRILAMDFAGQNPGSDADRDKLCARYDAIIGEANAALSTRRPSSRRLDDLRETR